MRLMDLVDRIMHRHAPPERVEFLPCDMTFEKCCFQHGHDGPCMRISGLAPPEQPHTGRVCVKCHAVIGRNDKFKQLAVVHDDCRYPQGAPQLPGKLARYIEEGL